MTYDKVITRIQNQDEDDANAGDKKAMQLLLNKGGDITPKNRFGNAALHKADSKGYIIIYRFLLKNSVNINDINSSPLLIVTNT
ncbi:hypothetical protein TrVGV298_011819 [Trichoderma virens]|nr:hypothetical protein TrVGV298_011819 [Trichoderma virens]